jgi:hypothetical protein
MAGAISGAGITYHAGYLTSSRVLTNSANFQVYHGENKLISNERMNKKEELNIV